MHPLLHLVVHLVLAISGIICLGALPSLFVGLEVNVEAYIQTIKQLCVQLLNPTSITYGDYDRLLFPQLFVQYGETLIIFISAFVISLVVATLLVYGLLHMSNKAQARVKAFLLILESIPDVAFILGVQLVVVWIFQQTGIIIFRIVGTWDETVRALPIICLSIPTIIMFTKMLLLRFEDELVKDYVLLAKAKGMRKLYILHHHIYRNVMLSILFFSKTIIWFMLSNLFIVEYLFNSMGIFMFIYDHPTAEVFTISLLLLYIPIFCVFHVLRFIAPHVRKEEI
ncbi:ABC transporter permease subunit [Priestia taiwanensis]|nr:ABC transporter permease subunit [Priestia taiwanensis]